MKAPVWSIFALFILLYGGMHYYIYRRLSLLLPAAHWLLALALVFLVMAPFITAALVQRGLTGLAVPLAWAGYTWMGFAFLFFFSALAADAVRVGVNAVSRGVGGPTGFVLPTLPMVLLALLVAVGATVFGYFAARQVRIARVDVPSAKIPENANPLRVVQISDLHLGLLTRTSQIQRLVDTVDALHPDIVVSTGDLIDVQPDHLSRFAALLAKLHPPLGKYAVTGNHEAYAGLNKALTVTREAGFMLLSERDVSAGPIIVRGVDDPAVLHQLKSNPASPAGDSAATDRFVLLLKHQPMVDHRLLFDLQLSGHTHGGQIFPFGLFTRLAYANGPGLHNVGNGAWLYVSRGTGTWGPPIRVLAQPEVTVFVLHHGSGPLHVSTD